MEQLLHWSWTEVTFALDKNSVMSSNENCEFRTFDYDRIYPVYFVTYYDRLSFATMCGVLYPPIKPLQPKRDVIDVVIGQQMVTMDCALTTVAYTVWRSQSWVKCVIVFQFRLMMVVRLTIRRCCDHLYMQHCSVDSSAKQCIILSHLKLSIDGA